MSNTNLRSRVDYIKLDNRELVNRYRNLIKLIEKLRSIEIEKSSKSLIGKEFENMVVNFLNADIEDIYKTRGIKRYEILSYYYGKAKVIKIGLDILFPLIKNYSKKDNLDHIDIGKLVISLIVFYFICKHTYKCLNYINVNSMEPDDTKWHIKETTRMLDFIVFNVYSKSKEQDKVIDNVFNFINENFDFNLLDILNNWFENNPTTAALIELKENIINHFVFNNGEEKFLILNKNDKLLIKHFAENFYNLNYKNIITDKEKTLDYKIILDGQKHYLTIEHLLHRMNLINYNKYLSYLDLFTNNYPGETNLITTPKIMETELEIEDTPYKIKSVKLFNNEHRETSFLLEVEFDNIDFIWASTGTFILPVYIEKKIKLPNILFNPLLQTNEELKNIRFENIEVEWVKDGVIVKLKLPEFKAGDFYKNIL